MRFTASRRSSTVSTRGCRISSKSRSGNCASSALTSRAAVSPVESEMTCSSTGGFALTPRRVDGGAEPGSAFDDEDDEREGAEAEQGAHREQTYEFRHPAGAPLPPRAPA